MNNEWRFRTDMSEGVLEPSDDCSFLRDIIASCDRSDECRIMNPLVSGLPLSVFERHNRPIVLEYNDGGEKYVCQKTTFEEEPNDSEDTNLQKWIPKYGDLYTGEYGSSYRGYLFDSSNLTLAPVVCFLASHDSKEEFGNFFVKINEAVIDLKNCKVEVDGSFREIDVEEFYKELTHCVKDYTLPHETFAVNVFLSHLNMTKHANVSVYCTQNPDQFIVIDSKIISFLLEEDMWDHYDTMDLIEKEIEV